MDIGIEKIKNWGSLEYLISVEDGSATNKEK